MYLHVMNPYGAYVGTFEVFGDGFRFTYANGAVFTGTLLNQSWEGRSGILARSQGFSAVIRGLLLEEGGRLPVEMDGMQCTGVVSNFPTPPVQMRPPAPVNVPPPPMPPPAPANTGEGEPAPAGSQDILTLTAESVELTIQQDPGHTRYHFSCLGKATRAVTLGSMSYQGDLWVLKTTNGVFAEIVGLTPEMTMMSSVVITFRATNVSVPLSPPPLKQQPGLKGSLGVWRTA